MAWTVERSAEADLDLALIFDFLLATALDFGEPTDRAFEQASRRVLAIEDAIFLIGNAPHQGTLDHDLLPGLRRVTKERAGRYYDTDEAAQVGKRCSDHTVAARFHGKRSSIWLCLCPLTRPVSVVVSQAWGVDAVEFAGLDQ